MTMTKTHLEKLILIAASERDAAAADGDHVGEQIAAASKKAYETALYLIKMEEA